MDRTLNGIVGVDKYLDDIIVYAPTEEQLLCNLRNALEALNKHGWQVSATKSIYGGQRVKLLGHIISANGIEMDPEKIKAITQYERPKDVRNLRAFLGVSGYYRRFLSRYSDRTKPLTLLLQKDVKYEWGPSQERAFNDLKIALTTYPILRHFDPKLTVYIHTDASAHCCAAACVQMENKREAVVASRTLSRSEMIYNTYERERHWHSFWPYKNSIVTYI